MVWLDRTGLILQFLAFWLVAPEILGHAGVHRLRSGLTSIIRAAFLVPVGLGVLLVVWSILFRELSETLHSWHRALGLSLAIILVLLVGLRFFRTEKLKVILDELEDDERYRRRFLSIGIFFFSFGFLLQFAATF